MSKFPSLSVHLIPPDLDSGSDYYGGEWVCAVGKIEPESVYEATFGKQAHRAVAFVPLEEATDLLWEKDKQITALQAENERLRKALESADKFFDNVKSQITTPKDMKFPEADIVKEALRPQGDGV